MPIGDRLFSMLRWPFAAPAKPAPAADAPKAAPALMRDAIYSESMIYSSADWPKYNPDLLLGAKGWDIYRKMMTDEQVKAVTRFKRDAVTARQWYFDTKPTRTGEEDDGVDDADTDDASEGTGADGTASAGPLPSGDAQKAGGQGPGVKATRARFDAGAPLPAKGAGGSGEAGGAGTGTDPAQPVDPAAEAGGLIPEADDPKSAEEEELERRAEVLAEGFRQMEGSFRDALNGIMTSMMTGFSMTEKVFKQFTFEDKTWIGPKYLRLKPFYSFHFYVDEFGNIERTVQRWATHQEVEIPLDKFIRHVHNPEFDLHFGCSELRDAYRAWFSKDMVIRFMNLYLERMAGGFVVIHPSQGAANPGTAASAEIKSLLTNLSAKNGILLPAGLEAQVIYPGNTDMYEKSVALYDKAIAKALLVPNLLGISEQGDTGSYSQSQTQLEAFLWTLDAEAGRLEDTINKQLIEPLCDINFGEGGPYPLFKFEPISETLKMAIIKMWGELVRYGAVKPTDSDECHIRKLMDFPEAGEPLSAPPSAPAPTSPGQAPASGNPPNAPGAAPGSAQPGQTAPGQKPGQAQPGQKPAAKPDETIIGKGQMKSARDKAFARAVKRVDFAVIDNRGAQLSSVASTKLVEILKDATDEIKRFVREEDLFANPDKISDVKVPARMLTRARKVVEAALKGAWEAGAQHAQKELHKAKAAPRFAVDTLRLQEEAAQKFLEARSYTVAGDLADNLRKNVVTVLYNGIKGGWSLDEIESRIDDAVGSDVLPHAATAVRTTVFEAINEARYELFASPEMDSFVEALEYSAILDGKTTEICQHMDGLTYKIDSPVWDHYTPPLHFNCRSLLVAVTVNDTWEESPPPDVEPMEGFGGG